MTAQPVTPVRKKLAVIDQAGNRASSTPPINRSPSHLRVPLVSPSSRHSSPGYDHVSNFQRRVINDDLIPRRLTASPVAQLKDKDRTRKRLAKYHSIEDAVNLLKAAKNVVVLSGAGISTSLDIPDFRSDDGFYSRLSSKIGITTPEEFFSMDFFKHDSESFWDNVKPLLPRYARGKNGQYQKVVYSSDSATSSTMPRFSATHAFLALLDAKRKLLTNYTQNIDGLEFAAGVNPTKIVQCHGSWETATCLTCGKTITAKKYLPIVAENGYPRCKCSPDDLKKAPKTVSPRKKKRKRRIYEGDSDHDSDDGTRMPRGLYKPDITFFGEAIPDYYSDKLEEDQPVADLLIIMGTSLKVRPVKTMVLEFPPNVPQIWINRDRFSGAKSDMPGVQVDIELLGDCDVVVEELCRRAGLDLENYTWRAEKKPQVIPPPTKLKAQSHGKGVKLEIDVPASLARSTDGQDDAIETTFTTTDKNETSLKYPFLPDRGRSSNRTTPPLSPLPFRSATKPGVFGKSEQGMVSNDAPQPGSIETALMAQTTNGSNKATRTETVKRASKVRIDQDLDAEWRWRFVPKNK